MKPIVAILVVTLCASAEATTFTRHVPAEYPTIQAAVNASGAGDVIEIAHGTYPENVSVVFKTNLTLRAKGKVIVDAGAGANGLNAGNSPGLTVRGIEFRNGTAECIALGNSCTDARLEDLVIRDSGGAGVRIFGSRSLVRHVRVFDSVGGGILVFGAGSLITRCEVVRPGSTGISLAGARIAASRNKVVDGLDEGIAFSSTVGLASRNVVTHAKTAGIFIGGGPAIVDRNVVKNAEGTGIDISNHASVVTANRVTGAGGIGIDASASWCKVSENQITKSGGLGGLYVGGMASYNTCIANRVVGAAQDGVLIDGIGSENVLIRNVAKKSVAGDDLNSIPAITVNAFFDNLFKTVAH